MRKLLAGSAVLALGMIVASNAPGADTTPPPLHSPSSTPVLVPSPDVRVDVSGLPQEPVMLDGEGVVEEGCARRSAWTWVQAKRARCRERIRIGVGDFCTEMTFIFGSSRQFFGEPGAYGKPLAGEIPH
jgi:hypothetical protein